MFSAFGVVSVNVEDLDEELEDELSVRYPLWGLLGLFPLLVGDLTGVLVPDGFGELLGDVLPVGLLGVPLLLPLVSAVTLGLVSPTVLLAPVLGVFRGSLQ